jgi:hypothetical protein
MTAISPSFQSFFNQCVLGHFHFNLLAEACPAQFTYLRYCQRLGIGYVEVIVLGELAFQQLNYFVFLIFSHFIYCFDFSEF